MKRPHLVAAACAVAGLAVLATGCGGSTAAQSPLTVVGSSSSDHGYQGVVLDEPLRPPRITLTDTDGRAVDLAALTPPSGVQLIFFGYTNCPDVCPTTLADVASALRRMPTADAAKVRFAFVTTDPDRDTPSVLRRYLDRYDPRFVGLRADPSTMSKAADALGVALTGKEDTGNGGYAVGHGTQVMALTPDGQIHLLWLAGTTVRQYVDDLTRLTTQQTAWSTEAQR